MYMYNYLYNYISLCVYIYIYNCVYIYMSNKFLLASKQESKFNLRKMDSFNSSPRGTNFTPMIGTSSKKTKKNLTELMEMSQQKHTPSKCHLCRFRTFWCECRSHPPKSDHSPKFDWDRCTLCGVPTFGAVLDGATAIPQRWMIRIDITHTLW